MDKVLITTKNINKRNHLEIGIDDNMLVDNKISYKEFVAKQESTTSSV